MEKDVDEKDEVKHDDKDEEADGPAVEIDEYFVVECK